jgi:hypothetical protein
MRAATPRATVNDGLQNMHTSLHEVERRRRQSARDREEERRRRNAKQHAESAAMRRLDDDQVLTFLDWCALNGFSPATGRRIIAAGTGPVVTQLSTRRIGITIGNNRRWQESRAR